MKAAAVRRSAKEKARRRNSPSSSKGSRFRSSPQVRRERPTLRLGHLGRHRRRARAKKGFDIDRRKIQLHEPLKTLGEFDVPVKLHKDVTAHVKV